jgi:thymidylate synthase ThyX
MKTTMATSNVHESSLEQAPFLTPAPAVELTQAFARPFDNAVATARTCYASRVIGTEEVAKDEHAREVRDRIARETYQAGHHTVLQHSHFQFALRNVSRQLIWSFLHAHPFYNSEQVSQRYVEVKPGNALVPVLPERALRLYQATLEHQMESYHRLNAVLTPVAEAEYFRLFPGRSKEPARWATNIKRRAQEVARYVLPIATFAHLYHTISGLTLHRYHRLLGSLEVPDEQRLLVQGMVDAVSRHDPLFFRDVEDPLPIEETAEFRLLSSFGAERGVGGERARLFREEFDRDLTPYSSRLVDYKVNAEHTLAQGVRSTLGLTRLQLPDGEAIRRLLSPEENVLLAQSLALQSLSKAGRAMAHVHYTFKKKLSHSADSQDQRHRMVPASRPLLRTQYAGGEPDAVVPELIQRTPEARVVYDETLRTTFGAIDALLDAGVDPNLALYLLPNAFPVRFEESGDLMNLQHKWVSRLCYTAQEEIWRCSLEEVQQVSIVHPRIGAEIEAPCGLRHRAGVRPTCPEGPRYCGVPVWKLSVDDYQRVI